MTEQNILNKPLAEVDMPQPLRNSLAENGIVNVGQIIAMNRFNIRTLRKFGVKRVQMLNEFLEKNKLELSDQM